MDLLKDRDPAQERMDLIKDLRDLVLSFNGSIEDSPHYMQLARLLVSEAMLGRFPAKYWYESQRHT